MKAYTREHVRMLLSSYSQYRLGYCLVSLHNESTIAIDNLGCNVNGDDANASALNTLLVFRTTVANSNKILAFGKSITVW